MLSWLRHVNIISFINKEIRIHQEAKTRQEKKKGGGGVAGLTGFGWRKVDQNIDVSDLYKYKIEEMDS